MAAEHKITTEGFPIGTIVSPQSHPFFKDTDKERTFISGDVLSLPPLMVVTETLPEGKDWRCKCTWYSHASGQFVSTELSSILLKKISEPSKDTTPESFSPARRVILKTNYIELGKKKLSLKLSDGPTEKANKIVTALLTFTSPVMHVIGPIKSVTKETVAGKKSTFLKRITSKQLIKCKYFNPIGEKFSEVLLPYEALEAIVEISDDRIEEVNKLIRDKCLLRIASPGQIFRQTIIKPIRIIYKSGNYFIEGDDFLENTTVEILLEEDPDQFTIIPEISQQLPDFGMDGSKVMLSFVDKANLLELPQGSFWRIKYKSLNDTVTTRTIYRPLFCDYLEMDAKKPKTIDYVEANCILRNCEKRLFRIDRILRVEVVDLLYSENFK